jgi:hypothetical protein
MTILHTPEFKYKGNTSESGKIDTRPYTHTPQKIKRVTKSLTSSITLFILPLGSRPYRPQRARGDLAVQVQNIHTTNLGH